MKLDGAFLRSFDAICEPEKKDGTTNSRVEPWRVRIPFYQRPFAWGENEKEGHELIKKIIYDFNEYSGRNDVNSYFAGAIVTVKEEKTNHHDLIDGQQRITTLFLSKYILFLLQRAYIENLSKNLQYWDEVPDEINTFEESFNVIFSEENEKNIKFSKEKAKLIEKIKRINKITEPEQRKKCHIELIKKMSAILYLPQSGRSIDSTEISYYKDYLSAQDDFFKVHQLNFYYARGALNHMLLEALKSMYIHLDTKSGPSLKFIKESDNNVDLVGYDEFKKEQPKGVLQYAVAANIIFDALTDINKEVDLDDDLYPESICRARKIIEYLCSFFDDVYFCVVRSGNTNDAYTLFEVLNDRSLSLNDLDLIKNIFYRYYVENTNDEEYDIEKNISKLENIWSSVFVDSGSVFKTEILKYTFIQFLTGNPEIALAKDAQKYRKKMNDYLSKHRKKNGYYYKFDDIESEFNILFLANKIIEESGLSGNLIQTKCIEIEKNFNNQIALRTIHLLHALKQKEVLATFMSLIIKVYLTCEKEKIDFEIFENYLNLILRGEGTYFIDNEKRQHIDYLSACASAFWSVAMMSKDYKNPKQFANKVLNNSCFHENIRQVEIGIDENKDAVSEFSGWLNSWEYKNQQDHFKIRILFLNLLKLYREEDQLVRRSFFQTLEKGTNIQLDHIEPQNPSDIEKNKYFKGNLVGNEEYTNREQYVNCLGNMMILTPKENINKTNKPAIEILQSLKECGLQDWWLSKELEKKFSDRSLVDEYHVPNEDFFNSWKQDLVKYFKELIERKLYI